MPIGEEEYRGIRMKVLCVVGCVKSGRFYRKKSCFLLMKMGTQDGGRAREHPWGLNVQGCP